MKKMIGLLIAVVMVFSMMAIPIPGYAWTTGESVDLRVGIIGDSHVSGGESKAFSWFKNAVKAFLEIGNGSVDGFALTGDVVYLSNSVVDSGYDAIYSVFNETDSDFLNAGIKDLPIAYAMGNHEYPLHASATAVLEQSRAKFIEKTGKESPNHTVVMGEDEYTFLVAAADNYNGNVSSETEQFIMTEIDKALAIDSTNDTEGVFAEGVIPNSVKPVFVQLHHPIDGTIFNTDTENYSDAFVSFLKNRPQVIVLTGHMHIAAQIPATIWQDGFTIFQTSHLAGGYLVEWECTSTESLTDVHQSSMLEITDNVVKLYKLDLVSGELIGEPWIVDIPAIVADRTDADSSNDNDHYLYSADKRENPVAPYFPEESKIKVEIDANNAFISWSDNALAAEEETPNQQDNFVRGYKLEVCGSDGTVLYSNQYQAEFYRDPKKEIYSQSLSLQYDSTYTAKVYPMGGLGNLGEPIEKTFSIGEEEIIEGAVKYELEDYVADNLKVANTMASGEYLAGSQWLNSSAWANPEITFDITVETAGMYELSYALGQKLTNDTSSIEVYFNNELIGQNDSSYNYNLSNLGTYPWVHTPMQLYQTQKYLEKGTYPVKLVVGVAKNSTVHKFHADYFQVTPILTPELDEYKTTRIELDKYTTSTSNIKVIDGASGRRLVGSGATTTDPKITVPVVVNQSGFYDVTYAVGYLNKTIYKKSVSEVTVKIGDTVIGTNDDSFTETLSYNHAETANFAPMSKYEKRIWLDQGEYSLTIEMSVCSDNKWKYQADYIEFSHFNAVIASDETTTVEFEDFKSSSHLVAGASGDRLIGSDGTDVDPSYTIPVVVEESGFYDVTYAVGRCADENSISAVTLKVGDTIIGTNDDSYVEQLSYNHWDSAPMSKYEKRVWLDEGDYSLTFEVSAVETEEGNRWKYQADYIVFSPQNAEISASKESLIEFEDYKSSSHLVAGASGGRLIGNGGSDKTDPSYVIPVVVEESGFYNVTYTAGYLPSPRKDLSKITIKVGDTVIGTNDDSYVEQLSYNLGWLKDHIPMSKYEKLVWLDEGRHFLTFEVAIDSASQYKYQADYISFKPHNFEISATGENVVELENYSSSSKNVEGASGDKLIGHGAATVDPSLSIPVVVEESGYYDVEYAVGYLINNNKNLSKMTIMIGDKVIGTNDDSYIETLSYYHTDWLHSYIPMSKYEKKVWLDAGKYYLTLDIKAASGGQWKYQADYVSIAPSEDIVNVDDSNVEVFASYDKPVSGLAIIALYSGNSLVSVSSPVEVENIHLVTAKHTETKVFDKVKMFVWDSLDNCVPQTYVVEQK